MTEEKPKVDGTGRRRWTSPEMRHLRVTDAEAAGAVGDDGVIGSS